MAKSNDPDPWVRVIIVNYNAGPLIQACVNSLAAQTLFDFEAVIVDNASTDGSVDTLQLPDARFRLIKNASNVGFAAANNIGVRDCRARWIATLNPDAVADPTWLAEMYRGTQRHPGFGVFGATLVDAADPETADGFGDVLSISGIPWRGGSLRPVAALPMDDLEVFAACAAAALYDRESFMSVGGFDEDFFCYVEDVDLGFRLRLAGVRCMQLRRAIVRHYGSAITGRTSDFTLFHSFRNRLWLIWKDMPLALLAIALAYNLVCSGAILYKQARRKDPIGSSVRGLLAGLVPAKMWSRRRMVQRQRRVSTMTVARWLKWSLADLRQQPVVELRAE